MYHHAISYNSVISYKSVISVCIIGFLYYRMISVFLLKIVIWLHTEPNLNRLENPNKLILFWCKGENYINFQTYVQLLQIRQDLDTPQIYTTETYYH